MTATGPGAQELLTQLRRSALFRETVAMESSLGWPVPQLRAGTAYLTVPAFRTRPRDGGGVDLFAPHAHLTVAWPTGRVVAFGDHRFEQPWPEPVDAGRPVGTFPHPGLPADADAYRRSRASAFAFYDELLPAMAASRSLPAAWWERFAQALGPLVEPGLMPFYRVLGPKFFARILGATPKPCDTATSSEERSHA